MDLAPMLLTAKGKPDITSRTVLIARAERADEFGRDSHAGIEDVMWRTGCDERTVQRAERRLEAAGLMVRDGVTRWGIPRWNLDMTLRRDPAERAAVDAAADVRRAKNAESQRARRAATPSPDGPGVDLNATRVDAKSTRGDLNATRVDSESPEPSLNLPVTVHEPPTGERPPRTPPHRDASGATDRQPDSSQSDQDQPLQGDRNSRPRERDAPKTRTKCEHGLEHNKLRTCPLCRRGLTTTGDTP